MTCAPSVMLNDGGDKNMIASIRRFVIIAAGLISVLTPGGVYCAEELKFRHIRSLYSDDQDLALKQPEGVACVDKSEVIVADSGNYRLLRYVFSGPDKQPAVSVIKASQITYPVRTQTNSKKEIFVLDGKLRRIIRISALGKFSGFVDPPGMSDSGSYIPKSFHVDPQDNIYILNSISGKLVVLTPRGEMLKQIPFPQPRGFISDLTVEPGGNILLLDSVTAGVFIKSGQAAGFKALTGSLKSHMRFPANLTTDQIGRIYLVDRNGGKIIILARDGSYLGRLSAMGWKEGLLNHPSQICINKQGEIFVADTSNNRVQVFREIQ